MEDLKIKGGIYWKDVLNEIYTQLPHSYSSGKKGWTDDHPLAKKLKITGYELYLAVDFLEENGLLERSQADNYIRLSKKGFDVALQNEKMREDQRMQKIILFFTGVIAISTMFSFLASLELYKNILYQFIIVWIAALILLVMSIRLFPFRFKKKLFDLGKEKW